MTTYGEAEKLRDEIRTKLDNAKTVKEMDRLHMKYIEACNKCEEIRLKKRAR